MKKILIPFDGTHFPESALRFARLLNEKSPILLVGAFLPQVNYANLWSFSGGGRSGSEFIPLVEDSDADRVKENIHRFESFCRTNHIHFKVHKEYFNFALPELRKETRYTDLLIISSQVFYEQAGTQRPNVYLQEALHGVECPVIVVPEQFDFPAANILAYDGSAASVFAIKQFAYLFPEFVNQPTVLVHAKESENEPFPDDANIHEFASGHFPQLTWLRLKADPKPNFSTWVMDNKGAIIVSGSFGRSGFSMAFKKSFVSDVISAHHMPVFIAHK